jgi:6-phosphogluconolactonase (cycloisomerase 2 family)
LGASDIAFSPDGKFLAVTERLANQIVVFPLEADGATGTPVASNSNGNTPFSCVFTQNGFLVVTEAAGYHLLPQRWSSGRFFRNLVAAGVCDFVCSGE